MIEQISEILLAAKNCSDSGELTVAWRIAVPLHRPAGGTSGEPPMPLWRFPCRFAVLPSSIRQDRREDVDGSC